MLDPYCRSGKRFNAVRIAVGVARAALYIDAARRVRTRQAAGRLRRLIPPRVRAAAVGKPSGWRPAAAGVGASAPAQSQASPSPHSDRMFRAFGGERIFDEGRFWDDDSDGLLFLFHLHGFERMAEYFAGERSSTGDGFWGEVVGSWLDACARPSYPAWHPYPPPPESSLGPPLCPPAPRGLRTSVTAQAASLWRQARYLSRSLEHDVGGNHLIRNGVALVVAGAVFEDTHAQEGDAAARRRGLESRCSRTEVTRSAVPPTTWWSPPTSPTPRVLRSASASTAVAKKGLDRMEAWAPRSLGPTERCRF